MSPDTQVSAPVETALPDRVNLGSGEDYREGWHNVDVRPGVDPDEVVDLDAQPWPWSDDTFERALMSNVIEHLDDRAGALEELARVVEPGGFVELRFPHWNSPGHYTNATHEKTLTHRTFDCQPIDHLFLTMKTDCTRVRFGRALPSMWALWLADHIGHLVSEVRVVLRVRGGGHS